MAGTWRVLAGVIGISICAAVPVQAFGGGCMPWPPVAYYYYYPPVYYYYPRVLAVPDAAPASSKTEPKKTVSERAPVIIATHGKSSASPSQGRLKIGFWNLTGRDITLTVDGKTQTLAKNRSVSLELEREFTWQVDRLPAHIERVPDGLAVHEVVIRD